MSGTGGYSAKNGAREAPVHRQAGTGSSLGEDFPMLCETCLGTNPYVRMTKTPFGDKLCKISNVPYQGFKWKAGPQGRYKETIIAYMVAKERNICQCCLNDMVYGLPVGVRDAMLAKQENQIALPQSVVGQQYYYEQQAQMIGNGEQGSGQDFALSVANVVPNRQLEQFSRTQQFMAAKSKTAFRNLPKLCSFWLNGSCTRVLRKTCPFRPCCGTYVFPEIAGSARELCGELVKQLEAEGPAIVQSKISAETRAAFQQSWKGVNRDDSIRKRVQGDDDLTRRYLGKMKEQNLSLEPPEDQTITTLWLGNVDPSLSENDLRSALYPYGFIVSLNIMRTAKCAFVEYGDRQAAEHAATQMYNALVIQGFAITVNWAKPKPQGTATTGGGSGGAVYGSTIPTMLPPPGMERAAPSAYGLQGLPAPLVSPPPPPGPPPNVTVGAVRGREEGADGDDDDEEAGAGSNNSKRVAVESTANDTTTTTAAEGGDVSYITSFSSGNTPSTSTSGSGQAYRPPAPQTFRPLPPQKVLYPSMNPTRLGATGTAPSSGFTNSA